MPIYCPKCGTQNFDWAQSCQQCSAPLPGRGQQPGQPSGGFQQPGYQQPGYQQQRTDPFGAPFSSSASFGAPPANYASVGRRFVAHLLDGLVGLCAAIPGIFLFIIGAVLSGAGAGPRGEPNPAGVVLFLLGYLVIGVLALAVFLYQCYLLGRDGATLGKRWMGMKVLDANNEPLGFGKAFLRELVKHVIGNVCFLLWLWPIWDQEKQGLYDKLFATHVYDA